MVAMEAPAWGAPLGLGKGWANDVEEEEEAQGGELQAPAALKAKPVDEDAFPSLGAAMSGPAPGKKKKPGKGQKVSLQDFHASHGRAGAGGSFLKNEKDILSMLPKHARGEEGGSEDRFARGARPPRRDDGDFMPSKADESGDWGADRGAFQPRPSGGGFGGGRDRDADGGGFGGGRADEDGAWSRGSGFQSQGGAPRSGFGGGGGFGRADEESSWSRGSQFQASAPPRASGGNFGGAPRAEEDGAWSRGSQFRAGPAAGEDDAPGAADKVDNWARSKPERVSQQESGRSTFGGASAADDEDRWSRRGPARVDSMGSEDRRKVSGPPDSAAKWDKAPVAQDASAAAPAISPDGRRPASLPPRSQADSEDKWAKKPMDARPSFGSGRSRDFARRDHGDGAAKDAPAVSSPRALEEREASEAEQRLADKLEHLRLRIDAGEADADADEEGPDGSLLTVQQLYEKAEAELAELTVALEAETRQGKAAMPEAGNWRRKAPAAEAVAASPVDGHAGTTAELDPEDAAGFEEVVARSTAKKTAKETAKSSAAPKSPSTAPSRKAPAAKGAGAW